MNGRINIPFDWRMDNGQPKYFITYYGDIYNGRVIDNHKFDDRFFILSNNQMQEFQNLKEHTLENYQRLCWEIRDPRIIKSVFPGQGQIGTTDGAIDTTRYGNQVWKRMFVFGAGASAHCLFGDDKNALKNATFKPPLGNEIFDTRFSETLRNFEGAKLSVPFFKASGSNIEECLEEEWLALRNSYNPHISARHINLQFYLQTLFHWISTEVIGRYYYYNLYSLFANKLQRHLAGENEERVALVSFNYDTILDEFIEKIFHSPFKRMHDYIDYNKRPVLLFKPHGSCNWGWQIKNRQQLNVQNKNIQDALYEQHTELWDIYYRLLGDVNEMVHAHAWGIEKSNSKNDLGRYTINKNKIEVVSSNPQAEYFPALLMPYRDKDEFVMHYDHQNSMQWFAGQMEELYLIGWKGNEDVFNRLLKTHAHRLRKIVIVNPLEKKNKEVSKNLSAHLDMSKYKIEVVDNFEKFVLKEMDKIFEN